jgi:hypothetical protein
MCGSHAVPGVGLGRADRGGIMVVASGQIR